MKKRILLFMGLVLAAKCWAYDFKSGDLCYRITSKTAPLTVEVTEEAKGKKDNYATLTTVVVPETVTNNGKKYTVTGIGNGAFLGAKSMTSISLPKTIKRIEHYAFESCSSLPTITIPEGVKYIGYQLFCNTDKLQELVYSAVACESVGTLDHTPLEGKESIAKIRVTEGVKSLPNGAFCGTNIKEITIANSVEHIHCGILNFKFKGKQLCDDLKQNEYDNALYIGNDQNPYMVLTKAKSKSITSCHVHQQTKTIIAHAFEECTSLAEVTMPNTISELGQSAFNGCTSLKHVAIPESVGYIYNNTFYKCSSLESVTFPATCKVQKIDDAAFKYCDKLKSLELPNSVKYIGQRAISNCKSLESIKFGNQLEEIDSWGLCENPSLKTVTLPKSLKNAYDPFQPGCTSLEAVYVEPGSKNFVSVDGVLFTADKKQLVTYPIGRPGNSYTIPKTVTQLHNSAFAGSHLSEIVLHGGITEIAFSVFANCQNLKSFTFPEGITEVPEELFGECENLESITFPKTLKRIGDQAFRNCKKLKNLYIGDLNSWFNSSTLFTSLPKGYNLYLNGQLLTDVKIPDGADRIRNTFKGCASIKTITIPASVTYIDPDAFTYMPGLTQIIVNSGNKNYCAIDGVLYSADKTELFKVPQAKTGDFTVEAFVKICYSDAFEGCRSLNSITYIGSGGGAEGMRIKKETRVFTSHPKVTITIKSDDESKGEAYIEYLPVEREIYGSSKPVTFYEKFFVATPKAGYEFVKWSDGTKDAKYEARSYDSDFELTAYFKKAGEADPVISNNSSSATTVKSSSSSESKKDKKEKEKKEKTTTKSETKASSSTSTSTSTTVAPAQPAATNNAPAPVSKTKIKKKKK
ncbi:MAG: leucine-rich repeat domain-containing protein [Bacteroidales bacterium]|nr:leucine-rich repeat domain-containing protein [Bacteroidales bacterium]